MKKIYTFFSDGKFRNQSHIFDKYSGHFVLNIPREHSFDKTGTQLHWVHLSEGLLLANGPPHTKQGHS